MARAAETSPTLAYGLRAYATASQATLSPGEASLRLHERLCQELMAAKRAYQERRLDRMCRHLEKCLRVLLALQSDLKLTPGAAGPLILSGFYLHLFQRVRTILRNAEVEGAFDDVIAMVRRFCAKMRAAQSAP